MNGKAQFERAGFLMVADLWPVAACVALATELTARLEEQQRISPRARGGLRNVLRASPAVARLAYSEKLVSLVSGYIGAAAFPVRAIFFDKTDGANWAVPWHQDLTIAVAAQIETSGFGPWSVKDGGIHVRPPQEILAAMITVRLHLDDCGAANGALRVLPESHGQGELAGAAIAEWVKQRGAVTCEMRQGGALLLRPLLLHSSAAAKNPSHRRVLHIEYAATELPNGLKWLERP